NRRLRGGDDGTHVEVIDQVEQRVVDIDDRTPFAQATSVVDQHVEAAEFLSRLLDHAACGATLREIGLDERGRVSVARYGGGQRLRLAFARIEVDRDARALCCKCACQRGADAGT